MTSPLEQQLHYNGSDEGWNARRAPKQVETVEKELGMVPTSRVRRTCLEQTTNDIDDLMTNC